MILTLHEVGKANLAIPDREVIDLATDRGCALLTLNRRHFIRLHIEGSPHKGAIVCTFDPNSEGIAERIDMAVTQEKDLSGKLIRINV